MPADSIIRLFVAIDAPGPVREMLSALTSPLRGVNWTPPHQLHLTLRFIGEVDPALRGPIERALAPIRVEPFILPIEGVGTFPPNRPPRVIWAGIGHGHPRLHQLRQRIDDALLACGLSDLDVKTFHPHFTLGRCSPGSTPGAVAHWLKQHCDFEAPPFRVDHFILYQSELRCDGAVHTALHVVPLEPPA